MNLCSPIQHIEHIPSPKSSLYLQPFLHVILLFYQSYTFNCMNSHYIAYRSLKYFTCFSSLCTYYVLYLICLAKDQLSICLSCSFRVLSRNYMNKIVLEQLVWWSGHKSEKDIDRKSEVTCKSVTFPYLWSLNAEPQLFMGHLLYIFLYTCAQRFK